ncbi:MAG TPA: DUF262 domain-containing protein [Methanofastidiosum sp.]|nr:DUF262 domain-containing protein [Methanofastidiosum sp.]
MKTNFWSLITEYQIEIPIIQRDYAQGRPQERRIAETFMDAISDSLKNDKKLSLDFIYGKTNRGKLVPIDGQQRLTTLWLLHWYLALKENRLTEDVKERLTKFSYETRLSSQDFCKKLINGPVKYEKERDISKTIRDCKWFFLSWERDPTVLSMLNMLDIIHEKLKNNSDALLDKLISEESLVEFYFLPLEEFDLTDELYIKMNARGKPLTALEYLKAQLSEILSSEEKMKFDNEWLDIFWQIEKSKNGKVSPLEVDRKFFNFWGNICFLLVVEADLENFLSDDDNFVETYNIFNIWDKEKKLSSEYTAPRVFTEENISNIAICLDCLKGYNEKLDELFDSDKIGVKLIEPFKSIFVDFLKPHRDDEGRITVNYQERCRFYALYKYFIRNYALDENNKEIFKRWARIALNLINNTRIDEPMDFYRAIRSLKELSNHINDIYEYLLSGDSKVDFFLGIQTDEEKKKVKLIMEDPNWEELIVDVETHSYFNGQIGFILEYSKDKQGGYDQKKFRYYGERLKELFSNHDLRESYLFERALLAKGNYLVKDGMNYTFCNFEEGLRAKMDNWRKVFNDDIKSQYLKYLLDELTSENIQEDLNRIIERFKEDDWRKYFIKNPNNLGYCEKKKIRANGDELNHERFPKIYLLMKEKLSGRHAELYTYDLFNFYLEGREALQGRVDYIYSTDLEEPYIEIKWGNEIIEIKADKDSFLIKRGQNLTKKALSEVQEILNEISRDVPKTQLK